ncbi:hypothetical protein D0N36_03355 [Hymenobacter lapidiphilus]|uniref:hypothetical protein n=1 Tax=Hymenobacter sp. CCM 8763 TaxID=2303334 RepID=UPI000E34C2B0|nr:hypothetical protein [Hymenobacter sp. CCM 8763]RFP66398.1 hypothetical protein D0N36_03355 [Hymenobacter sp. CCM 8763]
MSSKKTTAKQVAVAIEEAPVMELNPTMTAEEAAEAPVTLSQMEAEALADEPASTLPEKLKKERGYSQSAIDKADLERLNGLKAIIKGKLQMSISNQRILSKALDCLGDQVEGFLNELVAEANEKAKAKDFKQLSELKAKLGIE